MSKFFNLEDRITIARCLREQMSFGEIAKELNRDRTTISKEVRKYSSEQKSGCSYYCFNACVHRKLCKLQKVCGTECTRNSSPKCSICNICNDNCTLFQEEICTARLKPPYVCNGGQERSKCTLRKVIYDPEAAQINAFTHISSSRSGICSTEAELSRLNSIVTPLIQNGQSLHQIYVNNLDELMCSEKTLYNYVDACFFDARNIDLPRKVKYRSRYKKPEFKVDRACRSLRTYIDFQHYISEHPELPIVQMDSVIGGIGGKVLLTIHFVNTSFMLAFLRAANTSQSVIDIWNHLNAVLGDATFEKMFPVILTDNGSEFSNPSEIENSSTHKRRTKVFYCDPSCPYQKGAIEVNHELIRRILPKGTSFNNLSQADINLMMNHINSYSRKF